MLSGVDLIDCCNGRRQSAVRLKSECSENDRTEKDEYGANRKRIESQGDAHLRASPLVTTRQLSHTAGWAKWRRRRMGIIRVRV